MRSNVLLVQLNETTLRVLQIWIDLESLSVLLHGRQPSLIVFGSVLNVDKTLGTTFSIYIEIQLLAIFQTLVFFPSLKGEV